MAPQILLDLEAWKQVPTIVPEGKNLPSFKNHKDKKFCKDKWRRKQRALRAEQAEQQEHQLQQSATSSTASTTATSQHIAYEVADMVLAEQEQEPDSESEKEEQKVAAYWNNLEAASELMWHHSVFVPHRFQ